MKVLTLAAILFSAIMLQVVSAQETEKTEPAKDPTVIQSSPQENIFTYKPRWGVGLQAGLLSGIGLGVRYHPVGRFAAQLVGGGIKLKDNFNASFGLEGQFDLDVMDQSRLYAMLGFGYYTNGADDSTKLVDPLRIGAGIGYEWAISTKMVFYGSLNFTYFLDSGDFWPLPQLGIFYYFK